MLASLYEIPAGNAGLAVKLRELSRLKLAAVADPRFRELAVELVRKVPEKQPRAEARAVSQFVRRVRYTRDPHGVELFQSPQRLAAQVLAGKAAGDCDDAALLGSALLEALGYPTRYVVGGNGTLASGEPGWQHIWLEWHDGRQWHALDDTAKKRPPGWQPDPHFDTLHRSAATSTTMRNLPDSVDLRTWPATLGGLGKFRAKKALRKVGKMAGKALGPAAALVAVVPGIGPAVALPVAAAAAAQKQQKAKKMRKAAAAAYAAAQQAESAEQFQPGGATQYELVDNAMVPEYAPPSVPMQYSAQMEPAELPDDLPQQFADELPARPVFAEDLGIDWASLFDQASNVVSQVAPKVLEQAQSGAFGKRAQRLSSSRAVKSAAALTKGVTWKQGGKPPAPPARGKVATKPGRMVARGAGEPGGGLGPLLAGGALILFLVSAGSRRRGARR